MQRSLYGRAAAGARAAALALATGACAGPAQFVARPAQPIGWPSPAQARIEFEFAYGGAADVERHPGFWRSLANLLTGTAQVDLVSPRGLACGDDEVLWIADPGRRAVHRLSLRSGEHDLLNGSDAEPFVMPVGVAVHRDGRVFVADSARARIVVLAPSGEVTGAFGDAAVLGRPTGIAYDPRGDRLLVVDTVGCRVRAFACDGELLATAGQRGAAPGEFNAPTFLCVLDDGAVAVVDSMNFRVQVLGPDLQPRSQFGEVGRGPGTFASPKGIAADADGHLHVVDGLFGNVQIFDPQGRLLLPFGSQGREFGQFRLPSGICRCSGDRLVVADGGNARIQVFHYVRSQT